MMKDSLKIVLIGAGSREFARSMIHDLILEKELVQNSSIHVVLVDIHAPSLKLALDYAQSCAQFMKSDIKFSATLDRKEALVGADFVLLSIAIKRTEFWEQDFRVPFGFGIPHVCGENGGPGSIFHSLRNLHTILPICHDIEQYCPNAWLLNFTNPESKNLTAILNLTNVKAIGLCHGFYSFQHFASLLLQRPITELDVRTAGMNHFYTYYKITDRMTGNDLRNEFEQRMPTAEAELPPLVWYLWKTFGVIGYISDSHIGEYLGFAHQIIGTLWPFGIETRTIKLDEQQITSRTSFEAWRKKTDVHSYMAQSGASGNEAGMLTGQEQIDESVIQSSGELAIPVIGDMVLDRKILRGAVNVLNDKGYIENLDRDTSIELPAVVDRSGVHPDNVGRLPEGFAMLIKKQQGVQRLMVEAIRHQSRDILLQALLLDPVVGDKALEAERMLDYMLELQKEYLGEFR